MLADFEEYKYNYYYIQDRPLTPGVSTTEILSLYTYFYGTYRITIYAADENLRGNCIPQSAHGSATPRYSDISRAASCSRSPKRIPSAR